MAEEKQDPPLTADDVLSELQAAGIIPTRLNMATFIAAARAAPVQDVDRRYVPHPLLALTPSVMSQDTPKKWAKRKDRDKLNAWRVGGRYFSDIASVERWIIEGNRLSAADLERWRKDMKLRFP